MCLCHGSLYDNGGRVVQGTAPTNLSVPHHRFEGEKKTLSKRRNSWLLLKTYA